LVFWAAEIFGLFNNRKFEGKKMLIKQALTVVVAPSCAAPSCSVIQWKPALGCALTFPSEAKFEIEAKISFRLEAKIKPDFT
jgi:hypothetical protein